MRTNQHITETRSIKQILNALPDRYVVRDLTERDYGIDLFIEIFRRENASDKSEAKYKATGATFHAQIKGTTTGKERLKNGDYSYPLKKTTLLYAEAFSTPFFLFLVDLSLDTPRSYFLWIQRYIREVVDQNKPKWRNHIQKSISLRVPQQNAICERIDKLEKIASRPKYIQDLVDFRESYGHLSKQLSAAASGDFTISSSSLKQMRALAWNVQNLTMIYEYNDCCISRSCAEELTAFIDSLSVSSTTADFTDIPHRENFALLWDSIEGVSELETFLSLADDDTTY